MLLIRHVRISGAILSPFSELQIFGYAIQPLQPPVFSLWFFLIECGPRHLGRKKDTLFFSFSRASVVASNYRWGEEGG